MKKLILTVMVAAFAVVVQAGDAKCAVKEKAGCCPGKADAKAECGKDAKSCPADKAAKDAKLDSPKSK